MTNDVYPPALGAAEIEQFIEDGFVRIDGAFPRALAEEGRAIMWRDIPCDPDDPATWTRPVVRLAGYGGGPFAAAANTPVLHAAFDQLVGRGRWVPRDGLGSFPVRFPHPEDPGDAGWHVDLSFPGEDCDPNEQQDFSAWRVNITSRGRALLMLFLFSDVGEEDAPVLYSGVPVRSIPLFPENLGPQNNRSVALLCNPKNIHVGLWRKIKIESIRDPSAGVLKIVATMRFDARYAEEPGVAKLINVQL